MKPKLMLFLIIAVLLMSCAINPELDNDAPKGLRRDLHDSYLSRTIDTELGVACYSRSMSQVSHLLSCVKIDKEDIRLEEME